MAQRDQNTRGVGDHSEAEAPFAAAVETHTAAVFFLGDRAIKVKKPVRYGFLDFTTPEGRRRACEREVELNRRLAPDVYLGAGELRGPGGEVWDSFVAMRRLPSRRALSVMAVEGRELRPAITALAALLAGFHAAGRSPDCERQASAAAALGRWRANASEMAHLVGALFDPGLAGRIIERAARYLAGRRRLFEARVADGRACDGHGDLLADDVFCLDDGPRVLDCLEFDDDLRCGDALGDVCSLAMDLERLGRADLATAFLEEYAGASGDRWPSSLAHHYIAYRAHVRALVAGLRFDQGDADAAALGVELLAMCATHLEAGRVRLIVVGGLPGTAKTTVARWVANALDAAVLRTDVVRKELAGIDPAPARPGPWREELYSPEWTAATYRETLERARVQLEMGRSVVLDGSFTDPAWRAEARRVAEGAVADTSEIRCVAPGPVAESRLATRNAAGGDASDADAAVARRMAERDAPWPEAAVLDTDAECDEVHRRALALFGGG